MEALLEGRVVDAGGEMGTAGATEATAGTEGGMTGAIMEGAERGKVEAATPAEVVACVVECARNAATSPDAMKTPKSTTNSGRRLGRSGTTTVSAPLAGPVAVAGSVVMFRATEGSCTRTLAAAVGTCTAW